MLPSEFCLPIPFFIFSKVTSRWQGKTWRGETEGRGQSRPGLLLSLCNFRLPLSSPRSFSQCTVLHPKLLALPRPVCWAVLKFFLPFINNDFLFICFKIFLFFREEHLKPRNSSSVYFFLSNFFFQRNQLCPYCLLSYSHPKIRTISQGDTSQTKLYCISLLSTANQFVYISHKLSQENGPQENNFLLTFLLIEIHFSSCRSGTIWWAWEVFSILIHEDFYCFLPFLIVLCPVSFKGRSIPHCQKNTWLVLDIFHTCAVNQVIPGLTEAFFGVLQVMFALSCALFYQAESKIYPGHHLLLYPPYHPLWPFLNEDLNLLQWCPEKRFQVSVKTYIGNEFSIRWTLQAN